MEKELLAQLTLWHEEDEFEQIADRISEIPEQDRDYDLISHLARALNNLNRYEEALEQLLSIAAQGETDPLWHFRLGYAYYYLDQNEEAVHAFERADQLDPGDEMTLMFLSLSRKEAAQMKRSAGSAVDAQSDSGRGSRTQSGSAPFEGFDFDGFWDNSDYALKEYVEAPPTEEMIASLEQELGFKLPASYIAMMKIQNGGIPVNSCFPTEEATSWAEDYISISGIMGIGRDKPYSLGGEFGSRFMIEDWGYPDIGVVICDCPSAGHDVVMLDYRKCGPDGEPEVIHVDQEGDYAITFLAEDFETFIRGLVHYDVYDTSEEDKQEDLRTVAYGKFSALLAELCGRVTEVDDIEGTIRTICTAIVEDKGYFSFHADERSILMYDLQFWLYTKSYPDTSREQYLKAYERMIAFGDGEFKQGGYAPGFITDWLQDRIDQGFIVESGDSLAFTNEAVRLLLERLKASVSESKGSKAGPDVNPEEDLRPFLFIAHDSGSFSVILSVGTYKNEIFQTRADEGFEGNGYDWSSLARVFLEEKMPELTDIVHFDPEADMFCVYSSQREAIISFVAGFKKACEDDELIRDLFSRAELD